MRLERILAIVMVLLERSRIPAKSLAGMFEVSLRTIYRDIDSINQAGIPIITTPGPGGGVGIMPQYKVEKKIFTGQDITALLMGLGFIAGTLPSEEIVNTLAKVKTLLPEEQINAISLKSSQISLDLSPWKGQEGWQQKFDLLRAAIQLQRTVTMLYRTRGSTRPTLRTIEPYRLILKAGQWYLQSYSPAQQGFRLYKLARMEEPVMTEETFALRGMPTEFSDFSKKMEAQEYSITLWAGEKGIDRVLEYCGYEDITPAPNGGYFVKFPFMEDDYSYAILMGFGAECRCMAPAHVRRELIRRLDAAVQGYALPVLPAEESL